MSSGNYDALRGSSTYSRYEPRRTSGGAPPPFQRRDPLPAPRRSYDSYLPPRIDSTGPSDHRNEHPKRNNSRSSYASNYTTRSPSPEPFSRISDAQPWDRPSGWRAPPAGESSSSWGDRKPLVSSPTTSARGRGSRDDVTASRMFEPSENWKQVHVDRPLRAELSSDGYRRWPERSPDRPFRSERSFNVPGNRNSYKRDIYPPGRSDTGRSDHDSYRPRYEDGWIAPRREPPSPVRSHTRRDSGSYSYARSSDRFDTPHSSRQASRKNSMSSQQNISPVPSPKSEPWQVPDADVLSWSYPPALDTSKRVMLPPPRAPSRSSIASTHVSECKTAANVVAPSDSASAKSDRQQTEQVAQSQMPDPCDLAGPNSEPAQATTRPDLTSHISPPEPMPATCPVNGPPTVKLIIPQSKQDSSDKLSKVNPALTLPHANQGDASLSMDVDVVLESQEQQKSPLSAPINPATVDQSSSVAPSMSSKRLELHLGEPSTPEPPPFQTQPILSPSASSEQMDIDEPAPIDPTERSSHLFPPRRSATRPIPTPEELLPISSATSKEDALRIVVMARLCHDFQTREARVEPILMDNHAVTGPPEAQPDANPELLIERMCTSPQASKRMLSFGKIRPSLAMYFEQRHEMVEDKVTHLKDEYLAKQEAWVSHCQALNDKQKTIEQEIHHTGRTTRRSTTVTDTVRSDFEMEQILASLGNDDATDPNHLSMRNLARIPDMISVTKGKVDYVFDDTSHRVEDPAEYYAPRTGIEDWTSGEKAIFQSQYARHPKQFGIIADSLPNKTAAQCVDYYYLHKKKFVDFRKVIAQYGPNKKRRRGMGKKKGNGLLADIALHDAEVNRGLAAESTSVSTSTTAPLRGRGRKSAAALAAAAAATATAPSSSATECKKPASIARRSAVQFEDTPTSTPTPEPESISVPVGRPKRRKAAAAATSSAVSTPVPEGKAEGKGKDKEKEEDKDKDKGKDKGKGKEKEKESEAEPTPAFPTPPSPPPSRFSVYPLPIQAVTSMSAGETTEQEPESRPAKRMKRTRKIKSSAIVVEEPASPPPESKPEPPPTLPAPMSATSKPSIPVFDDGLWSDHEKYLLLGALKHFGENLEAIYQNLGGTKSIGQIKAHMAKYPQVKIEGARLRAEGLAESNGFIPEHMRTASLPFADRMRRVVPPSSVGLATSPSRNDFGHPPSSANSYIPPTAFSKTYPPLPGRGFRSHTSDANNNTPTSPPTGSTFHYPPPLPNTPLNPSLLTDLRDKTGLLPRRGETYPLPGRGVKVDYQGGPTLQGRAGDRMRRPSGGDQYGTRQYAAYESEVGMGRLRAMSGSSNAGGPRPFPIYPTGEMIPIDAPSLSGTPFHGRGYLGYPPGDMIVDSPAGSRRSSYSSHPNASDAGHGAGPSSPSNKSSFGRAPFPGPPPHSAPTPSSGRGDGVGSYFMPKSSIAHDVSRNRRPSHGFVDGGRRDKDREVDMRPPPFTAPASASRSRRNSLYEASPFQERNRDRDGMDVDRDINEKKDKDGGGSGSIKRKGDGKAGRTPTPVESRTTPTRDEGEGGTPPYNYPPAVWSP